MRELSSDEDKSLLSDDAKVHLFVTHAGMGSTLEVAYRGVPGGLIDSNINSIVDHE